MTSSGNMTMPTVRLWIDLETTGKDPGKHGIVECGWIVSLPGCEPDKHFAFIRPHKGHAVDASAVAMHRPASERGRACPEWSILRKIRASLPSGLAVEVCGWGVEFDVEFIRAAEMRTSIPMVPGWRGFTVRDIKPDACALLGVESLEEAAKAMRIEHRPHRADSDVNATFEIARRLGL